jgi:hypothetical protein
MTKQELEQKVKEGANLYGADLYGADLRSADLYGANLYGADLRSANLRRADLSGANLYGADLYGANLRSANLYGADLRSANLSGVVLPAGYTWEVYLADVVPALLRVGGRPLQDVIAAWSCHEWTNCPLAVAFGVEQMADVPALYRSEAQQFVQLFDAGLIPTPKGA